MGKWIAGLFVLALISAFLGFGYLEGYWASVVQVAFGVFLVMFFVFLMAAGRGEGTV